MFQKHENKTPPSPPFFKKRDFALHTPQRKITNINKFYFLIDGSFHDCGASMNVLIC